MRMIPLAVCVVVLGLPAFAQDARPAEGDIDTTFTWTSIDLSSLPSADNGTVVVSDVHLVLTANRPGLVDKLAGRCLLHSLIRGEHWKATGSCALVDADGDMLFENITEENGSGHAILAGGTGKFAGITGEHDFQTTWYGSIREGQNQGVGIKKGHWRRQAM